MSKKPFFYRLKNTRENEQIYVQKNENWEQKVQSTRIARIRKGLVGQIGQTEKFTA